MKKIIILLLISSSCFAQFDLIKNQTNGLYSKAQNDETFMGISSGGVTIPVTFDANGEIDTATWGLLWNNGNYGQAYNKVEFMGIGANLIRIPVQLGVNSGGSFDPSTNNTFTGAQTFDTVIAKTILPVETNANYIGDVGLQYEVIYSHFFYQNGVDISSIYQPIGNYYGTGNLDTGAISFLNQLNTYLYDQTFTGRIIGDTFFNPLGAIRIIDTVTVQGRLNISQDLSVGNDAYLMNGRFFIWGSNSSATLGMVANSSADGRLTLTNGGANGFDIFTLGAGAITAGFFRGTTDTDITGWFGRSPDGTLYYVYVANGGGALTISATRP